MTRRLLAPPTALTIMATLGLGGCAADTRVSQLERRVDSLAVTLTALINARQDAGAPSLAESATVALSGAAAGGDPRAPVVVIEFTDYQCPFCKRHFQSTLPELWKDYVSTGRVRYLVRDLPLSEIHPHALAAARAARCAADQGTEQFWRYHDALFGRQSEITGSLFPKLAREVELDVAAFRACIASSQVDLLLNQDLEEARLVGLSGTPAFIIGPASGPRVRGVLIRGAYPYEYFRQAIDSALQVSGPNR